MGIVALLGIVPAAADQWGTNDSSTGAHPDEDPHTYCLGSSVVTGLKPNIYEAEWDALDPTQANVNFHSSCTLSGTSETDVVWTQSNLVNGVLAQTSCDNFEILSGECDQNYIKFDFDEVNEGNDDEIDQTITTCHELGHTAGLSHGSTQDDCMENVSTINPPTALKWRRYSSHHINDHINPWF